MLANKPTAILLVSWSMPIRRRINHDQQIPDFATESKKHFKQKPYKSKALALLSIFPDKSRTLEKPHIEQYIS